MYFRGIIVMVPLGSSRLVRNAPSERDLEPLREFGVEIWGQALLKSFFGEEEREYVSRMARGR